jgi:ATP-dependent Clp protease ATP-binding subunit ClpA
LALTEDTDAVAVLEACKVDLTRLKRTLIGYIDDELLLLVQKEATEPPPTAGFHRVVQRAVIHIQASGGGEATGANLLVAMFSESESHAFVFLSEQGVTRVDAVNFMVSAIRNGGAAA